MSLYIFFIKNVGCNLRLRCFSLSGSPPYIQYIHSVYFLILLMLVLILMLVLLLNVIACDCGLTFVVMNVLTVRSSQRTD